MSRDPSLPISARELTPHRPPLLLVDRLLAFGEDAGLVEATVRNDNVFLNDDGTMEEVAMVELIAQAYAVVKGYHNLLEGRPQRMGYLVGVRSAAIFYRVAVGDCLHVSVRTTNDFGPFKAARGEVSRAGKVMAECGFKVWMPRDDAEASSDE
ncbi:MAG: 3-hydroxyacyl-ACP dehydratase [Deltaproteobacteria bacterium]|nr:3-hydroxyacyl-ACP dehydratase [Deltaproteobacteria bacterium]MBW1816866.1 3-hydroxyacyl-ACP dehydratase [Deltaproteobacteria bacterium]MBW2284009.1 3-hydroxyacyl-ACP dehydratase [Deltaproteobacteria bacterium]